MKVREWWCISMRNLVHNSTKAMIKESKTIDEVAGKAVRELK